MQPTKCLECGGSTFEHGQYIIEMPVFQNPNVREVPAKCSVCLFCGKVALHVDDATLEQLRARNPSWAGLEAEL